VVVGLVKLGVFPWVVGGVETVTSSSISDYRPLNRMYSPLFLWSHCEGGSTELVKVPSDGTDSQSGGRRTHDKSVPLTFSLGGS